MRYSALKETSRCRWWVDSPRVFCATVVLFCISTTLAAVRAPAQQPSPNLSAAWTSVGPAQVASIAYGNVTGRVTAVVIDPADSTGNTIYLGTTGGGVWKSTNAAGLASSVLFTPLTDTLPVFNANAGSSALPSLSIGALAIGNGVLLAGTGDPNDAIDSYYGGGLLRSVDGGATWTLIPGSVDGVAGNHSFVGLSFAGLAFSSANPLLAVAAVAQASEGDIVNAVDSLNSVKGLYFSTDAGATWHMANIMDGSQTVQTPQPTGGNNGGNAATAVVWNPVRQRFYAAVRFHGYYESIDGSVWTRLAQQPGNTLSTTACPTNPGSLGSTGCPIFRGALAVQPVSGDMFTLTVDAANRDQGLYQDLCARNGSACGNGTVLFGTSLNAQPLEAGSGTSIIAQADYNLTLAASPSGTTDTVLYAGTVDLYRCSLQAGCTLRNTTNASNGCVNQAKVAPAQHAIATLATPGGPLIFLGNDGGIYRSTDGVNETAPPCSLDDANHFQNLNGGLGSLAEVINFAQDPVQPATLLLGLGALGSAGTGAATSPWPQLAAGEGGTVAIDPANPKLWYLSNGAGVNIARCANGANCTAADFASTLIGEPQVSNDVAAIHTPWLLDPGLSTGLNAELLIGTCRAWRGPANDGSLWSPANAISRPFGAPNATGCSATLPVTRSLATAGSVTSTSAAQNNGSNVLYAGLAGALDGGQGFGGHIFTTTAANLATSATVWTDLAKSPVLNDFVDAGAFNPGGFDVSSLAADPHDATGRTIYATVMGFAGNGINAPHIYRSLDGGANWTNISSNLPNAPANSVVVDPNDANTLYLAMDTGVYVTTQVANCSTANCWSTFGSVLPNSPAVQLLAAPAMATGDGRVGELRVATYGRGIWQIPLLTAIYSAAPAISLNPVALTFASQQVGTASATQTITVTNTGSSSLVVSSVTTSGDFSETNQCLGSPVAQGASCTVQVSFLPSATGSRTGLLTVFGNVPGGQATASLSGTATPPAAIVLTPATLNFPATTAGATSPAQNITISNQGTSSVALQTISVSSDFQLAANTCTGALAPQTGCTVSIVFAPTTSGPHAGTLTINDDAGTQTASLSGTATSPPTDALAPLTLSFSAQPLGTLSQAQQVTLTNVGDVALTLIAARITNGDFTVVSSCGNSLNAHASCTFSVAFVPASLGPATGVLTVSDQFRTQNVSLSGLGVAPVGVSLSPTRGLAFASSGVQVTSALQTVTLTNNSGVPLTFSSVTASGDFFLAPGTNTCGNALAVATACTVQVGFTPTQPGARTGLLTFSDSGTGFLKTLPLNGTGVDFSLNPDGPVSATTVSGGNVTYALLLRSDPNLPGTVAFTCSGVPAQAMCTVNPPSPSLGGATLVTVTVATGLATAARNSVPHAEGRPSFWFAAILPIGLLALRRRSKWLFSRGLAAMLAVALLATAGCGTIRTIPGDGSQAAPTPAPGVTPPGTYTLVVAGSSAGLVRSINLSLTVR